MARDNLIGKLAEVAFAKMLKRDFGIETFLDFYYYPRGVWDDQDVEINGWRIDVKGSRSGALWLLVEWNKLNFRFRENKSSHVYVMGTVGWDRESDVPVGYVDIIGYAYLEELNEGVEGTQVIRKGDKLPDKSVILQADNFGRRFSNLHTDWSALINRIISGPPR